MNILHLDHFVLTVADVSKTCDFYASVMGMQVVSFRGDRKALRFGHQKINLHQQGKEFEPKARHPLPGSADLCFLSDTAIEVCIETLKRFAIPMEEGPVERTGATGPIRSIYFRDPDGNLIEVANSIA